MLEIKLFGKTGEHKTFPNCLFLGPGVINEGKRVIW